MIAEAVDRAFYLERFRDYLALEAGTSPHTVSNYARDVVAFLSWAADPTLEERKRLGLLVMGYLLITAMLFGFAKRRIWREVH